MVVVSMPICDNSGESGSVTLLHLHYKHKEVARIADNMAYIVPNARPKPNTTHITLTNPITMKL